MKKIFFKASIAALDKTLLKYWKFLYYSFSQSLQEKHLRNFELESSILHFKPIGNLFQKCNERLPFNSMYKIVSIKRNASVAILLAKLWKICWDPVVHDFLRYTGQVYSLIAAEASSEDTLQLWTFTSSFWKYRQVFILHFQSFKQISDIVKWQTEVFNKVKQLLFYLHLLFVE